MRRSLLRIFLAAACLLTAHADPVYYNNTVKYLEVIPPPPADQSPAGLSDLETVLQVQADRTDAQVKRAKRIEKQTPFTFARPIFGDWFTEQNLPMTKAIFDQIGHQTNPVCDAAKKQWDRPRPYTRDPRVHPVVGLVGKGGSYPSGHSYGSSIWGVIFIAAFPEHTAEIEQQMHESMWGRVMGGVHYPSDTQAATLLARAVGKELLKSTATQHALQIMRKEMAPFLQAKK